MVTVSVCFQSDCSARKCQVNMRLLLGDGTSNGGVAEVQSFGMVQKSELASPFKPVEYNGVSLQFSEETSH